MFRHISYIFLFLYEYLPVEHDRAIRITRTDSVSKLYSDLKFDDVTVFSLKTDSRPPPNSRRGVVDWQLVLCVYNDVRDPSSKSTR